MLTRHQVIVKPILRNAHMYVYVFILSLRILRTAFLALRTSFRLTTKNNVVLPFQKSFGVIA